MQLDYCVHVKVATGSSDVQLRTDPRTLASVYEETLISAFSATAVLCEINLSGAYWFICRLLPHACHSPGLRLCVCVFRRLYVAFWLGILGRKNPVIWFCMACAVLSLVFQLNLLGVGGVQWGENDQLLIVNLNWIQQCITLTKHPQINSWIQ